MGIPGLTTFVNSQSDRYLVDYELCDTNLIVDGKSIACQLYNWHGKSNSSFAGDYDKYAENVSRFFHDLQKCNVTPLVLFDGGNEKKKMKTTIRRCKDKIRQASSYTYSTCSRTTFFPLFMLDVFINVLRNKGIRHAQCLFEADNAVAAVAKMLNSPVLSYDSDFYIFGVLYIPFDTLTCTKASASSKNGYVTCCKIFKTENLLQSFKGLKESMLPLAAVLLGNDYVSHKTFRNFYQRMKLRQASCKKRNHQQIRIKTTFMWLSRYTLDKAVIGILCSVPKFNRQRLLNTIETNINSYTNYSDDILVSLGFSEKYALSVKTHCVNRIFQFDGNIDDLTFIEETYQEPDSVLNDDEDKEEEDKEEEEEEEDEDDEEDNEEELSENFSETTIINNLPLWFINDFKMAKFPSYFMDFIVQNLYLCPVQMEDISYPSNMIASLEIIKVIYKLLTSGIYDERTVRHLRYMIRGKNNKLQRFTLDSTENSLSFELPALSSLREIPLIDRKKILNDTLKILDHEWIINEIPPEWMLYIATAKYWFEQQQNKLFKLPCYLYSLILGMLYSIIDGKIGMHRKATRFLNKFSQAISNLKGGGKTGNREPREFTKMTIKKTLTKVHFNDCLLAAGFLIPNFEINEKLKKNRKLYDQSIVHAFAEFQGCLKHSMNLNALLGYPYQQTDIATLINGTFLYNICYNFKTRKNVELYIHNMLQGSQTFFQLFNVILAKVKPMFATLFENGTNEPKRERKKRNNTKSAEYVVGSIVEDHQNKNKRDSNEPTFNDPNNYFTLLTCIEN